MGERVPPSPPRPRAPALTKGKLYFPFWHSGQVVMVPPPRTAQPGGVGVHPQRQSILSVAVLSHREGLSYIKLNLFPSNSPAGREVFSAVRNDLDRQLLLLSWCCKQDQELL